MKYYAQYRSLLESNQYQRNKSEKDNGESSTAGILMGGTALAGTYSFFLKYHAGLVDTGNGALENPLTYAKAADALTATVQQNAQSFLQSLVNALFGENNIILRIISFFRNWFFNPLIKFLNGLFTGGLKTPGGIPEGVNTFSTICSIGAFCVIVWWVGRRFIVSWMKKHENEPQYDYDGYETTQITIKDFAMLKEDMRKISSKDLALLREDLSRAILSRKLLSEGMLDWFNPFYLVTKLASSMINSVTDVLASISRFVQRHKIFVFCVVFICVMILLMNKGDLFNNFTKEAAEVAENPDAKPPVTGELSGGEGGGTGGGTPPATPAQGPSAAPPTTITQVNRQAPPEQKSGWSSLWDSITKGAKQGASGAAADHNSFINNQNISAGSPARNTYNPIYDKNSPVFNPFAIRM